jgi:hypothetical protein
VFAMIAPSVPITTRYDIERDTGVAVASGEVLLDGPDPVP